MSSPEHKSRYCLQLTGPSTVGISHIWLWCSICLGFLIMTQIMKVKRLDSGVLYTHTHIETVLAHIPGSWNCDLCTSPTIHHGLASSQIGWVRQLRNIRTHRHLWPICTQRVLGAVYQILETLRLTFILAHTPTLSLSLCLLVYFTGLHCNSV